MELTDFKVSKVRVGGSQDDGNVVVCYGKVISDNNENEYSVVKYSDNTFGCTCIGKLYHRGTDCKHIRFFEDEIRKQVHTEPRKGFWNQVWCSCSKARTADPVYFEDEACGCGIVKHHYHCRWCGGVVQIG